ncbi:MAG: CHAT domain-containing protein, partial [Chloroflexales bacterium]|nr:CHAT domain-containing protein [Chloroflexales bacterium]
MDDRPDGAAPPARAGGEALIAAFFEAMSRREIERCEAILAALAAEPGREQWCVYFTALLVNERDHNYGRAEGLLRGLLAEGPEPALAGRVPLALGRTYDYQGRWAEAIAAYEQSLPVFAARGAVADQARAWKQIAIAYRNGFAQGDFGPEALDLAEGYCRQALAALPPAEAAPPDMAWLVGSVWNTLGLIAMNQGRWDEAVACYERDLAIAEAQGDRYGAGVSRLNLGEIYHGLGRLAEAGAAYAEALATVREFGDRFLEADVLANQALLLQAQGADEAALARFAEAVAVIEVLRAGVSSEEARAAFFATAADTYANAVLHCLGGGQSRLAFAYVERARSRAFLDTLAAGSPDLPERFAAAPLDLAEVQATLPADALLLEYFTTGLVEAGGGPAGTARRHRFPPPRTLLFAITRDEVAVHDLGLAPNSLLPALLDSVVERHFLRPEVRRRLFTMLLGPVSAALARARRLYLVPHGPLHYIPFQSLIAPDGDTLLRGGGPELVYGPSATVLFQAAGGPGPGRDLLPLLACGANGEGATRLRFAEEEARAVARLAGGDALRGLELGRAALYERAPAYRLLHLSCHGAFDSARPLESALYLGPNERLTALDIIQGPRLSCELVVLSACESGLSRVRRGDELVGLVRAFRYAGAAAVLSTLWRVDERSTRIFMELFYRRVQTGAGFAAALAAAQLELRRLTRRAAREMLLGALANDLLEG